VSVVLVWLLIGGCVVVLGASLFEHHRRQRQRRQPSPAELELSAMRAAARIRSMANAAEDYMDTFIQKRHAEQQQPPRWWPRD
jgi:hypothetical protein